MKTSLIINPVAFRTELYKCFFWYRPFVIHGKRFIAVPSNLGTDFMVSLHRVDETDNSPAIDPRDYHKLPYLEAIYNHHFKSDNCVALRSTSVEDYYNYFFAECSAIEKQMKNIVPNENPASPHKPPIKSPWYPSDAHPKDLGEGYSIDVLVDMNGQRKDFQTGWYDFDAKKWLFSVGDTSTLDLEKMEWRYIPE